MPDDEHLRSAAHHAGRFAQDHFDQARVLAAPRRELPGLRGHLHALEIDEAVFGLRHDFLAHEERVFIDEAQRLTLERGRDQRPQGIAGLDFRHPFERDERQGSRRQGVGSTATRMQHRARSASEVREAFDHQKPPLGRG